MGRRVTLDGLAVMVVNGFKDLRDQMQIGLQAIRDEMANHGGVLGDHSQRLQRIERKLDNTIERVDDHGVRLERVEKRRRV